MNNKIQERMKYECLKNFDPDRVELFLSFINHIDIINVLTENEIRIIFDEFNPFLFNLVHKLGISELIILIYLEKNSRTKLSRGFNEDVIFCLLENFERYELDIILKSFGRKQLRKIIDHFEINEFKLLFEFSRLKNNFNNLIFFTEELNRKQKNKIFKLELNRLTQFLDLENEQKKFLIENYDLKDINVILKKNYIDQIIHIKELNPINRIRILKFKDLKYILNEFESNTINSLIDIFSDLDIEELSSRKEKGRIEFINQKYSSLILT